MTPERGAAPVDELARRVGHDFTDPTLLARAMAHRSWCAEHPGTTSNERLEFLGDAILGWVVADLAYRRFQDLTEGALTGVRKGVVNAVALAESARALGMGQFLLLGKGEDAAGGRDKASILSDAFEATIGALYIDGGPLVAAAFVERTVGAQMADVAQHLDHLDHKSRLQELAARAGLTPPSYRSESSGPDHAKEFVVHVDLDGESWGEGTGSSKKSAEQVAARQAAAELERRLTGA